jgi:DNA-binding beta-propeller fold protein YncE
MIISTLGNFSQRYIMSMSLRKIVTLLTITVSVNSATMAQSRIYWLEFTGLHSANADGTDRKTLVPLNDGPDGVAVDAASGKVYWTNMGSGGMGSVQRANLDGSSVEYVVPKGGTYFPKQIQLDLVHGKAYWSDRDGLKIQRCNLDGSQNEILISGLKNPVGMALDIAKGVFYFSEKNGGTVRRAPMSMPATGQSAANRKDVETLISGLTQPIDVAVDLSQGKIYWTDRDEGTVHRAGIEIPAGQTAATRKDIDTLMHGLNTPIGVTLDLADGKLYTTESGTGAIFRANLDGTDQVAVIPARANATLTGICFVPSVQAVSLSMPHLNPTGNKCAAVAWTNVLGERIYRTNAKTFHGVTIPVEMGSR